MPLYGLFSSKQFLLHLLARWHHRLIRLAFVLLCTAVFFSLTLPILAANPGDLDPGFGTGGVVTTTIGNNAYGRAITIQADGKIIVAGYSERDIFKGDFALARYSGNGSLDSSFGNGGVVTTTIGLYARSGGVIIQPDGKIVAAGDNHDGTKNTFALARYTITGSLDSNFGNNGVVTTSIGSYAATSDIAIQPDGKIVVLGHSSIASKMTFALARYSINGSLDADFGNGGILTTAIGDRAFGNVLVIQPDGKIVAVGGSGPGSSTTFALARYTITGSLDSEFGNGGVITTPIGSNTFGGLDVAIQSDHKIVVIGFDRDGAFHSDLVLARYSSNGSLDNNFGAVG
jgi:uncharacterized delta-60 repeat protein